MKLTPLNNNVMIIEDVMTETASGIILSQQKKMGSKGIIWAIEDPNEWQLEVGDHVVFSKYSAEDLEMEDEDGNKVANLVSVPIDMITARLHD